MAAAIEQNNDERGIKWPKSISPFDAMIVEIDGHKDSKVRSFSETIYNDLKKKRS